jgi:hypothetical protein
MNNVAIQNAEASEALLSALGEQLRAAGAVFDLVVVGGSALLALGLVDRATKDIDVLALRSEAGFVSAQPLPEPLIVARDRVARDFLLPREWLNSGPVGLLDFGLPDGFEDRLVLRTFGPNLTVRFAARVDQIHFKLYAAVDESGPGKHRSDLIALSPTADELIAAARWSRQHDPSEGYREMLANALSYFGVQDADLSP